MKRETGTPAAAMLRLAVLLEAGLPPLTAWSHLGETDPIAARVAEADGADRLPAAILETTRDAAAASDWACIAAAWRVATDAGAPLAATLARLGEVLVATDDARREVAIALAGPLATTRVVLALPALGLFGGALLGVDTLGVLASTPPGWFCLVSGGGLLLIARRWMRRLVARAREADPTPGLGCELVAVAVSGGAPTTAALDRVADALAEAGLPADDAAAPAVAFAQRAGVPVAALLRAEAREARRDAQAAVRLRIAALGTRLLLPLGLCVLPAFVALGVAPLLLAMIGSTLAVL
ncbi:MAG TPA: type II secretion system F family protein [Pseudolysinimonas sp.]|nr:type II secretion system F family protein [Pseudolysinimonas sp.]